MNKLLLEIACPSVSKNYDFWIPKQITVKKAITIIIEEVRSYEGNEILFSNINETILFSKDSGYLDKSQTFESQGIKSGDTLVLL